LQNIFEEITSRLVTEEHVWQILDLLPECRSGLLPIAISLLGPQLVQRAAFDLLERIESTGVGAKAVDQLPLMLLMAYRKLKSQKKDMQRRESIVLPEPIQMRGSIQRLRNSISGSFSDSSPTAANTSSLTFHKMHAPYPDLRERPVMGTGLLSETIEISPVVISMVRKRSSEPPDFRRTGSIDTNVQVESSDEDDIYEENKNVTRHHLASDDSVYASSDVPLDD
jgi:hypothetical protein